MRDHERCASIATFAEHPRNWHLYQQLNTQALGNSGATARAEKRELATIRTDRR